jgi:hypothetical protein
MGAYPAVNSGGNHWNAVESRLFQWRILTANAEADSAFASRVIVSGAPITR